MAPTKQSKFDRERQRRQEHKDKHHRKKKSGIDARTWHKN
jgi:hypothetical protein